MKNSINKFSLRTVSLFLAAVVAGSGLLAGSTGISAAAASVTVQTHTFTGYLIDEDCFVYPKTNPATHSQGCLAMKSCASSGYGLAIPQKNGSYRFVFLDGTTATASVTE
jgi:hypothetical protein